MPYFVKLLERAVKEDFPKRGKAKKCTVEEIENYLIGNQITEENYLVYYAHIDTEGNLVRSRTEADATFEILRDVENGWNLQNEYDKETLGDKTFREMAEFLTAKINAWIENGMN